jgi:outer membrane receptor protein involved in Fe transport
MRLSHFWRIGVTFAVLIVAGGRAGAALAVDVSQASAIFRFNIAPQPLASALNELALQSRQMIVASSETVSDLQSSGVSGELTVEEALAKLLDESGLSASRSADGIIMIVGSELKAASNPKPLEELTEITITGSRVVRNSNDSPTPVTTLAIGRIQATRPTTIFEGLNDLPVFAGSRGAVANPGGAGGNNNNISALNLRALGLLRTLVLYDGHRVPPTNQDGLVDVNMIPQMLLQQVEIVTGGASAVYGSDAVSGVVNFVTDRRFEGLKFNAQSGISQHRDDRSYELSFAFGKTLSDGRGHVEGSYQTHDDAGILHRLDRELGTPLWTLQGAGTAAQPFSLVENSRIGDYSFGGKIRNGVLANQQFAQNGILSPFADGSTAGVTGVIQIGGDGSYHTAPTLKAPLNMHQLFGRVDFNLTDDLHYFLTTSGTLVHGSNNFTNNRLVGATLSAQNAYLAPIYRQLLTTAGQSNFQYGKMWAENMVPPSNVDFYTRHLFVNSGLEGKFGDGYRWEASYTHSIAKSDSRQNANIDNGRLYAALDAVVNPADGQIVCSVTLTNPALYPDCVPLNVFGPTAENPAATGYFLRRSEYRAQTVMNDFSGSITGAPLDSWAGPVNMAVSVEWRRLRYQLNSSSLPVQYDPLSCTGLRFNCIAGVTARWGGSVAERSPVSMNVGEAALEADLPFLKGHRFGQLADLNTAIRFARYSATGSPIGGVAATTATFGATTWKLGLDWHYNDQLTLRATRSRDDRAPNLNDLYQPGAINNAAYLDTLTNTSPLVAVQTGGNPNLTPEVAYTSTLGVVYKPSPKFNLSVDGFDISIRNAITVVNGNSNNIQQACYASGGASFYCTMQERPLAFTNTSGANAVTKWYQRALNIAEQKSWGADIEANYNSRFGRHLYSLRGLLTYQPHIVYVQSGVNTYDMAGVDFNNSGLQASAVWRTTAFARYNATENVTVDWMTRWRSRLHHNADPTQIVAPGQFVPSVAFSNLSLSYRVGGRARGQADIYLNVQNVFNQLPYPTAFFGSNQEPGLFGGFAYGDDPVGRYFSFGVRAQL